MKPLILNNYVNDSDSILSDSIQVEIYTVNENVSVSWGLLPSLFFHGPCLNHFFSGFGPGVEHTCYRLELQKISIQSLFLLISYLLGLPFERNCRTIVLHFSVF